jgi:hypothetical protein
VAAAAGLAVRVLGVPVRIRLPLTTNMRMLGLRNSAIINYQVGFSSSGLLTAVQLDYYFNCGFVRWFVPRRNLYSGHRRSPNDTIGALAMALTICDGAYHCDNWLVTGHLGAFLCCCFLCFFLTLFV